MREAKKEAHICLLEGLNIWPFNVFWLSPTSSIILFTVNKVEHLLKTT